MVENNDIVMVVDLQDYEIDDGVTSLIEENLAFNKALIDPRMWVISYQQPLDIRDQAMAIFKEEYENQLMRDINQKIIIPECQMRETSICDAKE